jgi:proline racemase
MKVYYDMAYIISEISRTQDQLDVQDARRKVASSVKLTKAAGQAYKTHKREASNKKGSEHRNKAAKHLRVGLNARREAAKNIDKASETIPGDE